ncbi:MAG: NUDIX domain-containing protein, partial [Verrucomicrobiales bacterium]
GHVDAGESFAEAAVRELREELGIEPQLEKIAEIAAGSATDGEFVELYSGVHRGALRPDPVEIVYGRFFPQQVIRRWVERRPEDFAPGFVACWRAWEAVAISADESARSRPDW